MTRRIQMHEEVTEFCLNCRLFEECTLDKTDLYDCMDFESNCDDVDLALREQKEWEQIEEWYRPSSTAGDYSPSCPWNAPGMSVRDFI